MALVSSTQWYSMILYDISNHLVHTMVLQQIENQRVLTISAKNPLPPS